MRVISNATPKATQTPIPPTAIPTAIPVPFSTLHKVSLQYTAPSEAEAIFTAQELGYIASGAHPSNMCGPLAAAILREGGVISPYIDLYDFWLLNPRIDERKIRVFFPENRFELIQVRTPINEYNFAENPLKTGDFLYLYAGQNGNFEHMLTVTRVDDEGRAYTVTNLNTDDGYYIDEFMLYDLSASKTGLIYRWNDRTYDHLGLTGSGGFDIWRPKENWDEGNAELTASINETLKNSGGEWHILIKELDGERLYARNIHEVTHIASIFKIPLAFLFLESIDPTPTDFTDYLANHGTEDRSYEQLLSAMLIKSEEQATGILFKVVSKNGLRMEETLKSWGLKDVNMLYRTATIYDLYLLLDSLYHQEFVSEQASELVFDLMGEYTENDDVRIGVLKESFPQAEIYNKRGTLTKEFLVIADAALVKLDEDRVYIVIIAGSQDKALSVNNTDLENAIEDITRDFAKYLQDAER